MSVSQDEKENSLDLMFHEALQAAQSGDRARARDLLTRLLKVRQNHVEYWIWMSAVVDTSKEKIFCLKEALRLDPQNPTARRGLIILGAALPDKQISVPLQLQKHSWLSRYQDGPDQVGKGKRPVLPVYQIVLIVVALIAFIGLLAFALWGAQRQFRPRQRQVVSQPTYTAVAFIIQTPTETQIPLNGSPVPLWMKLQATYTPTPLYVNTPHPLSEAYRIGLRALQREDWTNADNHFRQAATDVARNEPDSVDVLYYIAENARLRGELSDALEIYQQVITLSPDFAPAYLGRARIRQAQDSDNNDEQITADLQAAIEKDPGYIEAYLELVEVYIQGGQAREAIDILETAGSVINNSALAYMYRAQAYMQLQDTDNALESARRANDMDVTLLLPYRILGEALQANGDVPGSMEPLQIYMQYKKNDPDAWLLLANAYLVDDQLSEALKALDQAARLNNKLPRIYLLRAGIYLEMDDAEKALSDYETAMRLDPGSYDASLGTGKALMALDYPGDAWDRFERTRKLAETEMQKAELIYWRGQSLESLGEIEAALRDYQALIALPKSNVQEEWLTFARGRIDAFTTHTPTTRSVVVTFTPSTTSTRLPSRTPTPTVTKKP